MCRCFKKEFGVIYVDSDLGNAIWGTSYVNAKHVTFCCCGEWAAQSEPLAAGGHVVNRGFLVDEVGRCGRVMVEIYRAGFLNSRIGDHYLEVGRGLIGSTWDQA